MKAVIRNVSRTLMIAGGITLAATAANAQMKIGDNPATIKKSALLDLESLKQGLLLPRLPSFTAIDAAIATDNVDGMIVYLASGNPLNDGVYMRKAGAWVKIASAADAVSNWSLLGNSATLPDDPTAPNYIGTKDNQRLSIRTNGTEAINIQTDGVLQFKKVNLDATLFDVLVIGAGGTVSHRQLPITAFNSLLANVAVKADSAFASMNVTEDPTTKAITINTPIMAASSTAPYGFITKADWTKLQALSAGTNFTIADFITVIAAGQENRGGQITYDGTTASYKLELVAASATYAGIVTTTTQTFGGDKTFTGAAAIGGTLGVTGATTLASTLAVTGATTLNGATAVNNTLNVTGATTLAGATATTLGVSGLSTLGATTATTLGVSGASTLTGNVTLGTVAAAATAPSYDLLVKNTTTNVVEKKAFDIDALTNAVQFIATGTGPTAAQTAGTTVGFKEGTTGTDFNIVADGTAKTVTFNIPDASGIDATHTTAQRGAVTTGAQTFGGSKSFIGNVGVGVNTPATSSLQVEGSIAMKIRSQNTSGAVAADDNTIIVNTTGGAVNLTLPLPTAIVGRIYTIKKIGGGIDNTLTITPTAASSIEGGANGAGYIIYNDWTYITIQTDGTNWYIIKK